MTYPHNYLIEISYLGFRFHGWAKQPGVKTLQYMIERTLSYVLDVQPFKILGTSRTDAMVSALHYGFQLYLRQPIKDTTAFLREFNNNLPADILATSVREVPPDFNIIQTPKTKEYHYSFYFDQVRKPFCSPFITYFNETLDIDKMHTGCSMYEGKHNYRNFTIRAEDECFRNIELACIDENTMYKGSIFPMQSFVFKVRSSGFMRQQVRLMMGQLIKLGRGTLSIEEFGRSIEGDEAVPADYVAPASGLILYRIDFGI